MASSSAPTIPSSLATASAALMASSSGSPCAACKFLRRKCQPDCVFAPYFPPDNPQKFVHVHRVFGASNVSKLLNELHPYQREDAVNSIAYEAQMRLRDPVYGCVGVISILQHQLRQLRTELNRAKDELSNYRSAAAAAGVSRANFRTLPVPAHAPVSAAAGSQGFINVNHSMGLTGIAFGQDNLFQGGATIDVGHRHDLTSRNNYDVELAARLATNGAYDAGIAASLNDATVEAMGPFGGQFMKPNMAVGDELSGMRPL